MDLLESNIYRFMQRADNTFTSNTGQSISFIDRNGKWIFPLNIDLFTNFCAYVVTSEKGMKRCNKCNLSFSDTDNKINITKCHMGLSTISIPIKIENKDVFLITLGQILKKGDENNFYENLYNNSKDLDLDNDLLLKYSKELKVFTEEEIINKGLFLSVLSDYITISENELDLKNNYLLELREKIELENRIRDMEFKFLQSQLSPHFLFNTLNLLARTASEENASRTADLIYDLSDLLRRSFKSKNSVCSINEEIECVRKYLNIQRSKYGEILKVNIEMDYSIKDIQIPVLTIQPLIENIIIHAMPEDNRIVDINIKVYRKNKSIIIDIKDTGRGIDEERLKEVIKIDKSTGISNIRNRLSIYYNKNTEFEIHSMEDIGTHISIKIPYRMEV